jgi:glycosyltransferase involved in cell wall biosynthesis
MAAGLRASIIIPTHQRREALRRALLSLERQSTGPAAFEVIVAVDGSTDGTAEMLAEISVPYRLRVLNGPQRGRAAARNAALAVAGGKVVVLIDDDMQPAPHFVERHLSHHPDGSSVCALGAVPIELDESSPRAARYVKAKFDDHLANLAKPGHRFMPRDFFSGNVSMPAQLLRDVGAFDETFAPYGNEDVELSVRLQESGASFCYDAEALARQEYDKDLRGLASDTLEKGGTTVLLARRHPSTFQALRLAAPRDSSRPWLAARSILLWMTRRRSAVATLVLATAAALERLGGWRSPLFYRATLDYAFWAGVEGELGESNDDGRLKQLGTELHRGPIDLLLHG